MWEVAEALVLTCASARGPFLLDILDAAAKVPT